MFKPETSRPSNSEKYIVCLSYRKLPSQVFRRLYFLLHNFKTNMTNTVSLFPKGTYPEGVIENIINAEEKLYNQQIEFIENDIQLFRSVKGNINKLRKPILRKQNAYFLEYCKKMKYKKIKDKYKLAAHSQGD